MQQQLTYGGAAAATVVLLNYFATLDAPDYVVAAATTLFTILFMWVVPFIPKRKV